MSLEELDYMILRELADKPRLSSYLRKKINDEERFDARIAFLREIKLIEYHEPPYLPVTYKCYMITDEGRKRLEVIE